MYNVLTPLWSKTLEREEENSCFSNSSASFHNTSFADTSETTILLTRKFKVLSFLVIATYGKDRQKQQEHMKKR